MSLQIRDKLSPSLAKKAAAIKDRKPILEAMGLQLVSITKRSFSDAALRASAWPARTSGGSHSLLRKSGALWQSIRITETTNDHVTVGTDRIYGAVQQLGAVIVPKAAPALKFQLPGGKWVSAKKVTIPARPFFPFNKDGQMTAIALDKIRKVALAKIASLVKT